MSKPIAHGTDTGYHRCRKLEGGACGPCKAAHSAKEVANRNAVKAAGGLPASDPRHGTLAGYRAGCRCSACKVASSSHAAVDPALADAFQKQGGNCAACEEWIGTLRASRERDGVAFCSDCFAILTASRWSTGRPVKVLRYLMAA